MTTATDKKAYNVLTLNIGLKVGKSLPIEQNLRTAAELYRFAAKIGAAVDAIEETYGTEPTVVALLRLPPVESLSTLHDDLYLLSVALSQDCVSVARFSWGETDEARTREFRLLEGALVGPKSEEWGQWDPQYMVLHNFRNLGEALGSAQTLPTGAVVLYTDARRPS
jgi:hypothetical protein